MANTNINVSEAELIKIYYPPCEGEGTAVPPNIKQFNWGAMFGIPWLLTYGLYKPIIIIVAIHLFGMIPIIGPIISLISIVICFGYFGIKGNEWAWQNAVWKDTKHFQKVQKNWAIAYLIFVLLIIVSIVIEAIIIFNLMRNPSALLGFTQVGQNTATSQTQDNNYNYADTNGDNQSDSNNSYGNNNNSEDDNNRNYSNNGYASNTNNYKQPSYNYDNNNNYDSRTNDSYNQNRANISSINKNTQEQIAAQRANSILNQALAMSTATGEKYPPGLSSQALAEYFSEHISSLKSKSGNFLYLMDGSAFAFSGNGKEICEADYTSSNNCTATVDVNGLSVGPNKRATAQESGDRYRFVITRDKVIPIENFKR